MPPKSWIIQEEPVQTANKSQVRSIPEDHVQPMSLLKPIEMKTKMDATKAKWNTNYNPF